MKNIARRAAFSSINHVLLLYIGTYRNAKFVTYLGSTRNELHAIIQKYSCYTAAGGLACKTFGSAAVASCD